MANPRITPAIEEDIKKILKDIEEIKGKQYLGGDGWIVYKNRIDDSHWDIDRNMIGGNVVNKYKLTFTPDTDDTTVAQLAINFDDDNGIYFGYVPVPGVDNQWYIRIHQSNASGNTHYTMKFMVLSTQSGTMTLEQLI